MQHALAPDQCVEALTGLGLTTLQAKTYLAIAFLEKATIKAISKTAQIARQQLYHVTYELQEKGLIEKIIASPIEYRATPVQDAVNYLLQSKRQESLAAHQKAMRLLERIAEITLVTQSHDGDQQFVFVPKKEAPRRRFNEALEDTSVSVDGIFYWKGLRSLLINGAEHWKKNMAKGLKVRFIVYEPQEEKAVKKLIQALKKTGSVDIRRTSSPPPATLTIFDKEKILVTTSPTPKPLDSSSLWIQNRGFVEIFQDHFDFMWQTSERIQTKENTEAKSRTQSGNLKTKKEKRD